MPEIDFKVNEFQTYEARVEGISLGFIGTESGGYVPEMGEHLQYDGATVILKDGREFRDVPQLRTAIKAGWFTVVGDAKTTYRPKAANIQVRPTETRTGDPVVRTSIRTDVAEDKEVGSVAARVSSREKTNAEAARQVPFQSQEARAVLKAQQQVVTAKTGDNDLDELLAELDQDMDRWVQARQAMTEETPVDNEDIEARAEADILSLLSSVEGSQTQQPRTASAPTQSSRRLPVDYQDERPTMPIVKEDVVENAGTVVGNVSEQKRTVVERAQELEMKAAPARPPAPAPAKSPRLGGTGAIVVDEERDMGRIALSNTKPAIRLDESAKVGSSGTESIRMGDPQVGRKTAGEAPPSGIDDGVTVGRILSPTRQTFQATDANTSSTAIKRAQEGKPVRVERFQSKTASQATATGDVQEAIAADDLEDLLPDAAQGPKVEVHRRPEEDPAYAAVKTMIPDFTWNKDRPVKERVQEALKFIENPTYVKGILAVETEHAREEIKKAIAAELERRRKAKAKETPAKTDG